jgi:hypothetical protein
MGAPKSIRIEVLYPPRERQMRWQFEAVFLPNRLRDETLRTFLFFLHQILHGLV